MLVNCHNYPYDNDPDPTWL